MWSRSVSASSLILRICTFRIWARPIRSGRSTSTCRSNRPARNRAWSRISGRLVAASRINPLDGSKPSSSTSSWFRVCSFSSLAIMGLAPRARPRASSSSIKIMAGAMLRAWLNRARTRAAPTPTNISTNSEPLMDRKGTPAWPATARAIRVLPVPGGPTSSTPLGMWAPRRL